VALNAGLATCAKVSLGPQMNGGHWRTHHANFWLLINTYGGWNEISLGKILERIVNTTIRQFVIDELIA
jgi:hypothetical protein